MGEERPGVDAGESPYGEFEFEHDGRRFVCRPQTARTILDGPVDRPAAALWVCEVDGALCIVVGRAVAMTGVEVRESAVREYEQLEHVSPWDNPR